MTHRTVTLEQVKGKTIDDVVREIVRHQEVLTVQLPDGVSVVMNPAGPLQPLPKLEGTMPAGWKEAVYG